MHAPQIGSSTASVSARYPSACSRSASSSKHPCTSPMMSSGPCSSRLLHAERFPDNLHRFIRRGVQIVNLRKTFRGEIIKVLPQACDLRMHNLLRHLSMQPCQVARQTDFRIWQEYDRHGCNMILLCQCDVSLPVCRLHVGRVNDAEPRVAQALRRNVVECLESVLRNGLIALIVCYRRAKSIG